MSPYLSLLSVADLQNAFVRYLREQRQQLKLSRAALATKSGVPAATIKKFELTGQISLRQLLLLWQSLDRLDRLEAVCHAQIAAPKSIAEVLKR
ncbi:MAG: helix-turn-helix domain-containing protein [Sulfuriferula sp.]|nr:helix-turn-helix domain-containing protein [Sulfuriferula sp.]